MANVGQIYELNFLVKDARGETAVFSIPMGVETISEEPTKTELTDIAITFEALLDAVITGNIRAASVTIPLATYPANTLGADSDVEEGALFKFTAEGTTKKKHLRLATFDKAYFNAKSKKVNTAATPVANFLAALNGIVVGNVGDQITARLCDSEGRILDGLWSAEKDYL